MKKITLSRRQCDELYNLLIELNKLLHKVSKEYSMFFHYTSLMEKNLKICIEAEYDGIDELTGYLQEDWKSIFHKEKGMEAFRIRDEDIDRMAKETTSVQRLLKQIDTLLEMNLPSVQFLFQREWYTREKLQKIAKQFHENRSLWEKQTAEIAKYTGWKKASVPEIPEDIWTYAKFLAIAETDELLLEWFYYEIPAYGYLIPMELLNLPAGSDILRSFLLDTYTF